MPNPELAAEYPCVDEIAPRNLLRSIGRLPAPNGDGDSGVPSGEADGETVDRDDPDCCHHCGGPDGDGCDGCLRDNNGECSRCGRDLT